MSVEVSTKRVSGLDIALDDMRKPKNSHHLSDTKWELDCDDELIFGRIIEYDIDNGISKYIGDKDYKLARGLSGCGTGEGHDSFLKDIVVWYDIKADHSFIIQLYRYHFRDTSSSTSKMHQITSRIIDPKDCDERVSKNTIDMCNWMIKKYKMMAENEVTSLPLVFRMENDLYTKAELFEILVMNLPMGYEMTFGEITNYLQLKTIYNQRKTHKMSSWRTYCKWIESLPNSWLITGKVEDEQDNI